MVGRISTTRTSNYDARAANKSSDATFVTYEQPRTWWCYRPNKSPSTCPSPSPLINKQSSITDRSHEKLELPCDQRKHSKVLVEVARKRSTLRQGPLIQSRCSLASINREAFEVLGMWGSKENSSRKQMHAYAQRIFQEKCPFDVAKDEKKQKQKQKNNKRSSSIRFPGKMKYNSCTKDMTLHVLVNKVLKLNTQPLRNDFLGQKS